MRALWTACLLLTSAVAASTATAFPDGAPWGAADPDAEQDCAACHFEADAMRQSPALTIKGLPDRAEAGKSYDLEIIFVDSQIVTSGFQLLARTDDGDAGSFAAPAPDLEFIGASVRSVKPLRSAGRASWKISWHAPDGEVGTVEFYLAASAANDDGSPFGDTIHFNSYRIDIN